MFQTIAEYETDPAASEAERALIAACREGQGCSTNGSTLPDEGNTDLTITVRANLIRLLAVQATSLHENGVQLLGALITGTLDLRFAKCRGRLMLNNCRFAEKPQMAQVEIAQLSLDGSHFPGLFAQEVKVTGSIFLRGVKSTGTVNVSAAQIGGQFNCKGAELNGGDGQALNAQLAKVMGSVLLQDVIASGTTDLTSARIGGQIAFTRAALDGRGNLALSAQSLRVDSEFLFRGVKSVTGLVDLQSAQVRDLADDAASWKECKELILDGFTYDRISGVVALKTFAARKDWLEMGSRFAGEFRPQPYTQFAKVMRAAGHAGEARKALMARDRLLAIEARKIKGLFDIVAFPIRWIWDMILRFVAGYGFAPGQSFLVLALLLGLAWAFACQTWQEGSFAPNSDVILVSKGWQDLLAKDCLPLPAPKDCIQNPANVWSSDPQAGLDWDSFSAVGYAADLVVPILDLGQTSAWAPSKDRGPWGAGLWWGRWVFAALGWLVTALGAAAITGVIQRNAPD